MKGSLIANTCLLETVRVAGKVTSSLILRYDKIYSFKDYTDQTRRFMASAKKSKSYVQYLNGRRKSTKRFLFFKFYPKIEPGSTIFVAEKAQRQPMSAAQWLGIGTSMATLALMINQLTR